MNRDYKLGFGYILSRMFNIIAYCKTYDQSYYAKVYCDLLIKRYMCQSNVIYTDYYLLHGYKDELLTRYKKRVVI